MTTFRGRLTVALATTTGTFLSIFCLVLYYWCRGAFLSDLDADLEAILRAELSTSDRLEARLQLKKPQPGEDEAIDVFGLILEEGGRLVKSSESTGQHPPTVPTDTLAVIARQGPTFFNQAYEGQTYRVLGRPVTLDGRHLIEVVGISQAPAEASLRELRNGLLLSLVAGIMLFALISNRVARYLTRPLESIVSQLSSVTQEGNPSLRLTGDYDDVESATLMSQINAMLERLDKSFSLQRRFVSDASHELRAPLSNLTLALEVCLRRQRSADEYREAMETCHEEAKRLSEMANLLLTLSQSDEGAMVLHPEPADSRSLLVEAAERNRIRAEARGVEFQVESVSELVSVDRLRFAQVLDNVLDNALRFAPTGTVVLLQGLVSEPGVLELRVTDKGSGLSKDECDLLFERFYRSDASRHRGTGGAGLGLAIARAIVEAHQGEIGVRSVPGEATTFFIRLARMHSLFLDRP